MLLPNIRLLIVSLCLVGPCYTAAVTAADADQKALVTRVEQLVGRVTKKIGRNHRHRPRQPGCDRQRPQAARRCAQFGKARRVGRGNFRCRARSPSIAQKTQTNSQLLNTRITDAGLAKLVALKKLKSLNLQRDTGITDNGIAHVGKMPELTYLTLLYTRIGDAGLVHLADAKKLRLLDLRGCKITDTGLAHLTSLTGLAALKLRSSGVTDAGLAHLKGMKKLRGLCSRTQKSPMPVSRTFRG